MLRVLQAVQQGGAPPDQTDDDLQQGPPACQRPAQA